MKQCSIPPSNEETYPTSQTLRLEERRPLSTLRKSVALECKINWQVSTCACVAGRRFFSSPWSAFAPEGQNRFLDCVILQSLTTTGICTTCGSEEGTEKMARERRKVGQLRLPAALIKRFPHAELVLPFGILLVQWKRFARVMQTLW